MNKWLETVMQTVKPMDVSSLAVGEWYRDHSCDDWAVNNCWFYKSTKRAVHMTVAFIQSCNMQGLYDFRWDNKSKKWVVTKAPMQMSLLEFYKQYWYPHRMYKKFRETDGYKRLVKTQNDSAYLSEMCNLVYYRIIEYAMYFMLLYGTDKRILTQFAKDLLFDFGIGETVAAICYLAENIENNLITSDVVMFQRAYKGCKTYLKQYYKQIAETSIMANIRVETYSADFVAALTQAVIKLLY